MTPSDFKSTETQLPPFQISRAYSLKRETHEKLTALRHSYIEELPQHIQKATDLWGQLSKKPDRTWRGFQELNQLIQHLIGLSITCGLSQVVEDASSIAKLLRTWSTEPGRFTPKQHQQLHQLFSKLSEVAPSSEEPVTIEPPSILPATVPDRYRGVILVVDPDPDFLELMEFYLSTNGLTFIGATTGTEALVQIKVAQQKPDLILLATNLPDTDSLFLYQTMIGMPGLENTSFVYAVPAEDEEKVVQAIQQGVEDYILKPFNPNVLVAKLKQVLQRKHQHAVFMKGELQPGLVLKGSYEIVSEVARGGMGIVYMVMDQTTEQLYALKSLTLLQARDNKAMARFKRETEMLFKLQHPHLIRIYDADVHKGIPFYIMDYLPGSSLVHRLHRTGPLPTTAALYITARIGSALQHCHEHEILHRDIKAGNILFDARGEPILTDLGLALDTVEHTKRLTKAGCVTGTPCYMSPEQLTPSVTIDGRSDVFALGLVLAEMLIGYNPLAKYDGIAAMTKIMSGEIPYPREFNPDVPEAVELICRKALAHDRDNRYLSASELSNACLAYLESQSPL